MVPVIALVGRPNVGKSTMFNRMTRSRDAIVADLPGLTRDRKYGEGSFEERRFIVIDTGGIGGEEEGIDEVMAQQSLQAIEEADIVMLVVDAKAGLMPADHVIAKHLRVHDKLTLLVINKVDGHNPDIVAADFFALGFANVHHTAAAHNRGMQSVLERALGFFPVAEESEVSEAEKNKSVRIGIIGRPNVGKSTLVNRMLGEDRVVVYDEPGTTRDSIYIPYKRHDKDYMLIDTAGVRRRKNVNEAVEKFSIIKTLRAIEDANVVVMVIDARTGLVEQDLHLIGFIIDAGRSVVLAINKWDGMSADDKNTVHKQLDRRLVFLDYAKQHMISALHGTGVGELYKSIDLAYKSAMAKWTTNQLTRTLEDVIKEHQPPMVRGRRIKLRYAHQGGSNPPLVVIHGNQTKDLPDSYKRYLENSFRRVLNVKGTPIRFEFRSGANPYSTAEGKDAPRPGVRKSREINQEKRKKPGTKRVGKTQRSTSAASTGGRPAKGRTAKSRRVRPKR